MSGFAVLPNHIVRDPSIPLAEKAILLLLSGYANGADECWPSIETIHTSIGLKRRQTQTLVARLRDRGLVSVVVRASESKPNLYRLNFDRWGSVSCAQDPAHPLGNILHTPGAESCTTPVHSTAPKHNQLTKPVNDNNPPTPRKRVAKRFIKPSNDEVAAYFLDRSGLTGSALLTEAAAFIDHYEGNGWKVGRNPMKDWRASVRTWIRNDYSGRILAAGKGRPRGNGKAIYNHSPPGTDFNEF